MKPTFSTHTKTDAKAHPHHALISLLLFNIFSISPLINRKPNDSDSELRDHDEDCAEAPLRKKKMPSNWRNQGLRAPRRTEK